MCSYSCVVKKCPLEMKERLSTMTSSVHVDNVTQWLQTTQLGYLASCEFGTGIATAYGVVNVYMHT